MEYVKMGGGVVARDKYTWAMRARKTAAGARGSEIKRNVDGDMVRAAMRGTRVSMSCA